ncbi:MAG: hypothetical protein AAGJ79_04685 [Verrucomicrobiota bacterium]
MPSSLSTPAYDTDELTRPRLVPARLENGQIVHDEDETEMGLAIEAGQPVVFKDVFPAERMIAARRAIAEWGETTPVFPNGKSASIPGTNFHRRDDETTPTRMPHIFHQYALGDWDHLPEGMADVEEIADILFKTQNRLAETDFELRKDRWWIKAIRHPRGGGYLSPHSHPGLPQKVSLFLNLSEPGTDYDEGATRVKVGEEWIDLHEEHRCGDVLAWRYDCVHEISPVDPQKPLAWDGDDGLWIFAIEEVEVHPRSRIEEE